MTATVDAVLKIAASQVGTVEGPRNNECKFNTWYYGRTVYGSNYPWCDVFLAWVADQADATDIMGRFASTPLHAQWFKSQGRWGTTPRRGALVFFDWPDNVYRIQHIEIVEKVNEDGTITTIGGNTAADDHGSQSDGGGVRRRIRKKGIVGYGYPRYADEVKANPVPVVIPAPRGSVKLKKGMTLGAVATAMGVSLSALLAANPVITDANKVHEGQVINAPVVSPTRSPEPQKTASAPPVTTPPTQAPVTPSSGPSAPPREVSRHPTVKLGSKGPEVGLLQGVIGATVDNSFGSETQRKLKKWQKAQGLKDDGIAASKTWARVDAVMSPRTLRYGDTGEDVKVIQRLLKIDDDGIYKRATVRAVEDLQVRKGLKKDGVTGPDVRKALGL